MVLGDYRSDRQLDVMLDTDGFRVEEASARDRRQGAFCDVGATPYFLSSAPDYQGNRNVAFRLQRSSLGAEWVDIALPSLPADTYDVSLNCTSEGPWLTFHRSGRSDLVPLSRTSAAVALDGLSRAFSDGRSPDLLVVTQRADQRSEVVHIGRDGGRTTLDPDRFTSSGGSGEISSLWFDSEARQLYVGRSTEGELHVSTL